LVDAALGVRLRFENHAATCLSIHHRDGGAREANVAYATVFLHRWLRSEPFPINEAFARIGIHREVAYLEGCQVLEKMAALRRSDAQIAKASFNDHACIGNLVPGNRNSKP